MFFCKISNKLSEPGAKCHKVVVKKRERKYFNWFFNEEIREWEELQVGTGWEIVKEIPATEEGVNMWNQLTEDEKTFFAARL